MGPGDPDLSVHWQCELLGLHRSNLYYEAAPESAENLTLIRLIDEKYLRRSVLAQRKQELGQGGVDEGKGATSCREVAALCREGLTPWCQSPSRGSRAVMRPPGLRSWPLGRRSGRTSAEPYPPPKPSVIVTCEQSSGNLCRGGPC